MISNIKVNKVNAATFFDGYEIPNDVLVWLSNMVEEGSTQDALDILIDEYIIPPGTKYQDLAQNYLSLSQSGVIEQDDVDDMTKTISVLSVALVSLLVSNFSNFMIDSYSPGVFAASDITSDELKNYVMSEVSQRYEDFITGAINQTKLFVNNGIRTLQRELVSENIKIESIGLSGSKAANEILDFKNALLKKYPKLYNGILNGNIVTVSRVSDGVEKIRHYGIDYYLDLLTRTTIYDIDRISVKISAENAGELVVGYIWIDNRNVKKDREICQGILSNKVLGKSILALNDEAANKLGIMTVDQAINTSDYAMGPGCRHGLERLDSEYLIAINSLLEAA